MKRTLVSWNVNGIRAAEKKGFLPWLKASNYDIVSVQETKVSQEVKLNPELVTPAGYNSYWDYAEKKGYSGVASYVKSDFLPKKIITDYNDQTLAKEGRLLELDYGEFSLFNIYFPNGKRDGERLKYKLDFYQHFLAYIVKLKKTGKGVIFCGDVNTAHQEIDLARPKENSKVSGFLAEERAWIDQVVAAGFVDTLRLFHPEPNLYSWWDQFTHARERNVGWRIDYFFVSEDLVPKVNDAFILADVLGSDHAPVGIEIDL
jgi:exodeoxyribonuclease-3